MANRFEPKTTITRVDSSVSATINQTRATTYIGIEADTGRYDLQEINSSKQLVEKYSTKSKPSKADGVTILHAGKFLEQFSAHVKRVNTDTVHPGIDSLGTTLYFDKNYNLIEDFTKIAIQTNEKNLATQPLILKLIYSDGTTEYVANDIGGEEKAQYGVEDVTVIRSASSLDSALPITSSDTFISVLANGGKKQSGSSWVSFSGSEFFKADEVYSVKFGDAIEIYGSIQIENVVGFDIKANSNSLLYELHLDTNSTVISPEDIKCVLTTRNTNDIKLSDCAFRYNDVTYYPNGVQGSGIKTFIAEDINGAAKPVYNYRDAILSALENVYALETKPISYIDEGAVLKYQNTDGAQIFYKQSLATEDRPFCTEVSKSLKNIIPEILFATDSSTKWWTWDEISSQSAGSQIRSFDSIKFHVEGQINNVENGWISIYIAKYDDQTDSELLPKYLLFWFGYADASTAINKYLQETGVTLTPGQITPIQIDSPNAVNLGPNVVTRLISAASDYSSEFSEVTERMAGLTGTDYNNSIVEKFEVYLPSVDCSYSGYQWKNYNVFGKSTNVRYTTDIQLQAANMEISRADGAYWLTLNGYTFYNAKLPNVTNMGVGVKVSSNTVTPLEFIELVKAAIKDYYSTCGILSTGDIFIGHHVGTESESCGINDDPTSTKIFNIDIVEGSQSTNAKFAVVQKFTSSAKLSKFSIEFDKSDPEIIYFNNTYAFNTNNDTISFVEDKVNGYGVNLYYDKYNTLDRDFHLELLNVDGQIQAFTSPSFGNEVTPRKATVQDFCDAFEDLEDVGFKPFFIFDAGLTNNLYYKAAATFAEKYHAMVPATVPAYEVKNGRKYSLTTEQVKEIKNSMGNSTNRFVAEGWQRDVVFGDISFDCSPTYYYLQKVLSNTNAVSIEFQPIFWKLQGRIETSDPVNKIRKIKEREELLDLNVNSIIKDLDGGYSYFNSNYTDQVVESDFSEEQNVRISNKIAHIADNYIDLNVMGKNHTTPLRKKVEDGLGGQIQLGIMDNRDENTASSFRIVVDDTNNTNFGRKLTVDIYVTYNKSINEVQVYSRTEQLQG